MSETERNYCHVIDHRRFDRNCGCRRMTTPMESMAAAASEIAGKPIGRSIATCGAGGTRWHSQRCSLVSPGAGFFFNYHPGRWLWRGQLLRRFVKARH
jgi:hypothetical protein